MQPFTLQGSIAALSTPFNEDGSIDFKSFDALLDFHMANGTAGVVVCGTSGESPTLSEAEDAEMFEHAVSYINHRMVVIGGSGSNSTQSCIKYTENAKKAGVDAVLTVGPYYNKPTSKGMYEHFAKVASSVDIPIILYNVPGRTGSAIKPDVAIRLANDFSNIVGIKEASGNINAVAELIAKRPEGFKVYSGDDNLSMLCNLLGGDGCISVAANVFPKEFAQMMKLSIEGNAVEARKIFYKYRHIMDLLFIESNPIPLKAALAAMGIVKEFYRLPLCPMEEANKRLLLDEMKKLNLI
ncbi:MAG: 4-hydroxy-tetrahydrodipicolinate synthase [Marinilabiliaceae bacterium]|nr:4-hydroxy-tetrahydrodipicolinate synthase [Marinilabiliaceae bacterium]